MAGRWAGGQVGRFHQLSGLGAARCGRYGFHGADHRGAAVRLSWLLLARADAWLRLPAWGIRSDRFPFKSDPRLTLGRRSPLQRGRPDRPRSVGDGDCDKAWAPATGLAGVARAPVLPSARWLCRCVAGVVWPRGLAGIWPGFRCCGGAGLGPACGRGGWRLRSQPPAVQRRWLPLQPAQSRASVSALSSIWRRAGRHQPRRPLMIAPHWPGAACLAGGGVWGWRPALGSVLDCLPALVVRRALGQRLSLGRWQACGPCGLGFCCGGLGSPNRANRFLR